MKTNFNLAAKKAKSCLAISLLVGSSLLISCTRAKTSSSSMSISIPKTMSSQKVGSLASADILGHVVVNVTGEGIAVPIVFNWDAHENGKGTTLDKPIQLVVPQGPNRLIQVLAVYMDTQGTTMQFFYGDKVQTFSQANETVNLAVSSISQASTVVSGHISGRYILTTGNGPTGIVSASYVPSNGRPAVVVERSVMYNGWFNIFGLSGAKLNYNVVTIDGASMPLFNGASVDLSEASFAPSTTVGRLNIPTSHRQQDGGWGIENPLMHVYGFWGPGASSKNVCPYSAPITSSYMLASNSGTAYAYSGNPLPADFATSTALTSIYLQGANAANGVSAPCSNLNNYEDGLNIYTTMADNGKEAAAGFIGPFKASLYGKVFSLLQIDAATYKISASLLPGAFDVVSSVNVYKKMGDWSYEQVDCNPQALEGQGFQKLTQSSLTASDEWAQYLGVSTSDVANKINLAICPVSRQSGTPFPIGSFLKYYNFSGGGVSVSGQPAGYKVVTQDDRLSFAPHSCIPMQLKIVDSSSLPANVTGVYTTIVSGSGGVTFSTLSDCTSSVGSSISLSFSSYNTQQFFALMPSSGNVVLSASASTGYVQLPSGNIAGASYNADAGLQSPYVLRLVDTMNLKTVGGQIPQEYNFACRSYYLQIQDSNGVPFGQDVTNFWGGKNGASTGTFSFATANKFFGFSSQGCTGTPSSSFSLSANATMTNKQIWGAFELVSGDTSILSSTMPLSSASSPTNSLFTAAFDVSAPASTPSAVTQIGFVLNGSATPFLSGMTVPITRPATGCQEYGHIAFFDAVGIRGAAPYSTITPSPNPTGMLSSSNGSFAEITTFSGNVVGQSIGFPVYICATSVVGTQALSVNASITGIINFNVQ